MLDFYLVSNSSDNVILSKASINSLVGIKPQTWQCHSLAYYITNVQYVQTPVVRPCTGSHVASWYRGHRGIAGWGNLPG